MQNVLRLVVIFCACLPSFLRSCEVKELVFAGGQRCQNARGNRHGRHARPNTVEIDLERLRRLLFFLVFLFVLLLLVGLGVGSLLVVLLLVLFLLSSFLFVTLRRERRGFGGFQSDGEDAICGVVVVALIELPCAWIEVARRNEIKIFTIGIEDRVYVVIKAARDLGDFLRVQRIEKNVVGAAAVGFGIRNPTAVGRPAAVGEVAVVPFIHQHRFFVVDIHVPQLMGFIPIEQFLVVRRPCWTTRNCSIGIK